MAAKGTKFIHGATPSNIAPTADGKYEVTFTNGSTEVFDTVMAATGRTADTAGLNLAAVGVEASPKNGKLSCVDEQTNVPYVYAIGDVLQGLPELTPVAIQAGIMLARRMFGGASEAMDYKNIATAVFTPIEYGAIGLSEEEAIEAYGESAARVAWRHSLPFPIPTACHPIPLTRHGRHPRRGQPRGLPLGVRATRVVAVAGARDGHVLRVLQSDLRQDRQHEHRRHALPRPQRGRGHPGLRRCDEEGESPKSPESPESPLQHESPCVASQLHALTFARHYLHHLRASTSGTSRRPSASTRPPRRSSPPSP